MEDEIEIEGTEYTISGVDPVLNSPEDFERGEYSSGRLYGVRDSRLKGVQTDQESDNLLYALSNGSVYILHHWDEEKDRGLLEDTSGLKWLYDAEGDLTAYFDGENYVAAHNPDITDVWDEVISGRWMEDIENDVSVEDGMNRLHPEIRKRVRRGLP